MGIHIRLDLLPVLKWSIPLVVAIFIIAACGAYLTGSTFWQRCAKAYPESGYKQELCIERLSKGQSLDGLSP